MKKLIVLALLCLPLMAQLPQPYYNNGPSQTGFANNVTPGIRRRCAVPSVISQRGVESTAGVADEPAIPHRAVLARSVVEKGVESNSGV